MNSTTQHRPDQQKNSKFFLGFDLRATLKDEEEGLWPEIAARARVEQNVAPLSSTELTRGCIIGRKVRKNDMVDPDGATGLGLFNGSFDELIGRIALGTIEPEHTDLIFKADR